MAAICQIKIYVVSVNSSGKGAEFSASSAQIAFFGDVSLYLFTYLISQELGLAKFSVNPKTDSESYVGICPGS